MASSFLEIERTLLREMHTITGKLVIAGGRIVLDAMHGEISLRVEHSECAIHRSDTEELSWGQVIMSSVGVWRYGKGASYMGNERTGITVASRFNMYHIPATRFGESTSTLYSNTRYPR